MPFPVSSGKRILKIGYGLTKLWSIIIEKVLGTISFDSLGIDYHRHRHYYYYYYAAFNAPCVGHKADESSSSLFQATMSI